MIGLLNPVSATVSRQSTRTDGLEDPAWVEVATIVCQVSNVSASGSAGAGGRRQDDDAKLHAAPDADVLRGDRLVADGSTYEVTWVQIRTGLGLDRLEAGLRWSKGAS